MVTLDLMNAAEALAAMQAARNLILPIARAETEAAWGEHHARVTVAPIKATARIRVGGRLGLRRSIAGAKPFR